MSHEIADVEPHKSPPASERRAALLLSSVIASIITGAVVGASSAMLPALVAGIIGGPNCDTPPDYWLFVLSDMGVPGAVVGIFMTVVFMLIAWAAATFRHDPESLLRKGLKRGRVVGAVCSGILIGSISVVINFLAAALCSIS